jgi:anti-sigma B factor antagonist
LTDAPFKLELDLRGDRAVVRMKGELDVASAPRLRECVLKLIQPSPSSDKVGTVVLDLSNVTFVDSTGLGVIAASRQRVARVGGELILRGPRPNTIKVLEITGLDRVFTIEQ